MSESRSAYPEIVAVILSGLGIAGGFFSLGRAFRYAESVLEIRILFDTPQPALEVPQRLQQFFDFPFFWAAGIVLALAAAVYFLVRAKPQLIQWVSLGISLAWLAFLAFIVIFCVAASNAVAEFGAYLNALNE